MEINTEVSEYLFHKLYDAQIEILELNKLCEMYKNMYENLETEHYNLCLRVQELEHIERERTQNNPRFHE